MATGEHRGPSRWGITFHQAGNKRSQQARRSPGAPLVAVLVPDPANAYDPNALAVYINDEHVGFLPRDIRPGDCGPRWQLSATRTAAA